MLCSRRRQRRALSLLIILVLLSGLGNALSVQTLFSIFSAQLSDNPWLLLFLHCLEPFCNIPRQMQIPGHRTDYVAGVCSPPHREISAHRDRHWSVSKRVVSPVSEAALTANHTRRERLQQVNSSPTRLARLRRGSVEEVPSHRHPHFARSSHHDPVVSASRLLSTVPDRGRH